ncbi:hypothetical protein [Longimicrobium sp.]|jgi:hypothetical protein|uniref:hypothetical protein n=1 Tax=Longimicrobium sp. TaxID=2029185 RepID=UPI002ED797C6
MSEEWTELDDAIEEVRAVRRRLSARFGDDPAKITAHYMEYQKQFGDRLREPDAIEKPSGPGRSAA